MELRLSFNVQSVLALYPFQFVDTLTVISLSYPLCQMLNYSSVSFNDFGMCNKFSIFVDLGASVSKLDSWLTVGLLNILELDHIQELEPLVNSLDPPRPGTCLLYVVVLVCSSIS